MAHFNFAQAHSMGAWPLRELLVAYIAAVREQTLEAYRHTQLLYQVRIMMGGDEKPPPLPPLLREMSQQ